MKRNRIVTLAAAIIFALSLSTGGLTALATEPGGDTTPPESPVFTVHPRSQTVSAGQDFVLTVAVGNDPNPALQWQVSVDDGLTWLNLAGQTGTTLRLNAVTLNMNGNQYRSYITGIETVVVSNVAVLSINSAANAQTPVITLQPVDNTVLPNANVTLSVTANVTDNGTLSYQWFSNTNDRNSGGTIITGATARTFTPPTGSTGTIFYYAVITNTNNNVSGTATVSVASTTSKVTVNPLVNAQVPSIIDDLENHTVMIGESVMLSITARTGDEGRLTYQWFRNDTEGDTGSTPIRGATDAEFSPNTSTVGKHFYSVVITNTNPGVNGSESAAIASKSVYVEVITTPEAPRIRDTMIGENQVTLFWNAPDNYGGSEITGYQVSDSVVTIWIDANGRNEHTFSGLSDNSEYTFKVRAVNAAGFGKETQVTIMTLESEVINVTDVLLDYETWTLQVGEHMTLTATVKPFDAQNQSLTWASDDIYVAIVDKNGLVTALSPGNALITVSTEDGRHSASVFITVEGFRSSSGLIWIGLGVLVPLGTGTGIYLWKRRK